MTERQITIDGSYLRVAQYGQGKPLLVLHDELGAIDWLSGLPDLTAKRSLTIPFAPGFGRSPQVEWISSVRDLAAFYAQFLNEIASGPIDVLGFSFGGWVAAEMAANCSHQFNRMVLVAPFGIKPQQGEIRDLFTMSPVEYIRSSLNHPFGENSKMLEISSPEQLQIWEDARAEVSRLAWSPYMHNPSLGHLLRGIRSLPTLLLWGKEDAIIPATTAQLFKSSIPHALVQYIAGCGHRPEMEKPAEFTSMILKFLS